MKKTLKLLLLFCLLFMTCKSVQAREQKVNVGKFRYTIEKYKKGIWIQNIVPNKKLGKNTVLTIPGTINGKKVIKLGAKIDDGKNDDDRVVSIFGTPAYDGVKGKTFTSNIVEIKVPESVKLIANCCFRKIGKGKKINIPSRVVEKRNKHYAVKNNCLYSKKTKRLVYATTSPNKKIEIPEEATHMSEYSKIDGFKAKEIIFPKSFRAFGEGHLEVGKKNRLIFK